MVGDFFCLVMLLFPQDRRDYGFKEANFLKYQSNV
jgi:hypothetical protein